MPLVNGKQIDETNWFTCDRCGYEDDTDRRFTYPSAETIVCIFCKPERGNSKKALSGRFVQCYNCEYLTENWEILEGQNPVAQLCDDCLEKEKQNE